MKNIDLKKLNNEIEKFVHDREWDQFHSIKNLAMAMSVESSELLEIFQWMNEAESNDIKQNPVVLAKIEDEIADVFVYMMRILAKTDIDLEAAVMNKMKKNGEKYPIDKSKGNSKKYNDLG